MPQFETRRAVAHTPRQMFDLVADVERYPEFLPLCEDLTVRNRRERDGKTLLVADMTVGYKAIRETFTSQVLLKPDELEIEVKYIDGPFRYLDNRWTFRPASVGAGPASGAPVASGSEPGQAPQPGAAQPTGTEICFYIEYEFRNRLLGGLMGTMFDRGFRMFSSAFEKRADQVYGTGAVSNSTSTPAST
ncbi:type II toxin-antitoxin system RatA family toxin [Pseudohoeflea coraliihabitans]|uniref:Type II toxin-antitoxin system RatA family toxin n=1 Tax=Pseudohoeflea coraliihabitans TaxID=2860393 RepID=A0ABS6WR75_9HYPH|nr:type II toxin-antitoxin system RatA family toxin [Pseudohoeflea sp. DP4N28-3]MBW3098461.1 type II toxin-antitoxin system RatA family toxin [Pseudohoeflea sp. DP4N28-3]